MFSPLRSDALNTILIYSTPVIHRVTQVRLRFLFCYLLLLKNIATCECLEEPGCGSLIRGMSGMRSVYLRGKSIGGLKIILTLSSHGDVIWCPKLVVTKSSVLIKDKASWVTPLEIKVQWIWLVWVLGTCILN